MRFHFLCALCIFYAGVIDPTRVLASTMLTTGVARVFDALFELKDATGGNAHARFHVHVGSGRARRLFPALPDQFNAFLAWAGQHLH
jgi:hypothetical protein